MSIDTKQTLDIRGIFNKVINSKDSNTILVFYDLEKLGVNQSDLKKFEDKNILDLVVNTFIRTYYLIDGQINNNEVINNLKNILESAMLILKEVDSKYKITSADFIAIISKYIFHNISDLHAFVFLLLRSLDYYKNNNKTSKNGVLPKVRRRNGQVVPFLTHKIYDAVNRAFVAIDKNMQDSKIINDILDDILNLSKKVVDLETIQDIIIGRLIQSEEYEAAKAYALYRADRAIDRIIKTKNTPLDDKLQILEPNGSYTYLDREHIDRIIEFAAQGLDINLDKDKIRDNLLKSFYNGMKREDFNKLLIMNAKFMMELDYDFTYFASRILLLLIYEETMGWDISRHGLDRLNEFYKELFKQYIIRGIEIGRLDEKLLDFDLDELASKFDYRYDLDYTYIGLQTLYDRYFIIDKTTDKKVRIEAPQWFWMRVAMGVNILEKNHSDKIKYTVELFQKYTRKLLCSSTPTLFNSGTIRPQLSSCYLYKVDDSIESIMETGVAKASYLSKWAGGLGGSWTAVRGVGAHIKGTGGDSQGVIPFLKVHNDMLVAVNQGGKRSGSGCAYLETWHNDIFDFLELRRNTGDERRRTHDLNTANWIPDLFMKRVFEKSTWTLFRSNEVADLHELYGKKFEERYLYYEKLAEEGKIYGQKVSALELWKQMLRMLYETGHPWMTFKDPCNIRSPQDHVGVVHSSNLCTEITLNTSHDEIAVCNLASIVLPNFLNKNNEFDYELMRETIRLAVRILDNVIDVNYYPVPEAENANKRHRAIGLGIMGWHDVLLAKNIRFDSQEAVELADELMEFIAYEAYNASCDLAIERGVYSTFHGSKWSRGLLPLDTIDLLEQERGIKVEVNRKSRLDWDSLRKKIQQYGMRNSNVIAIAPTATISNIMGVSPSIEPYYSNMYVKSNLSGDFVVLNKYMVKDLKNLGLWRQDIIEQIKYYDGDLSKVPDIPEELAAKYKTAFQIHYKYIIDQAAVRQKWIDQSQSVNLFLSEPDMATMSHMYKYAWLVGLKTTYYLRTLGASTIEKSTVSKKYNFDTQENLDNGYDYDNNKVIACSINAMLNGTECEACQ
ncbi:MAG: ribonucleoside-diphosphate reductase subunit alpha [Candidatus Bilamarchaeaceae archaeon]